MKLIILAKENFSGKDTRKWVKVTGVSPKGKAVESVMAQADYDALAFPEENFLTPADLSQLFKDFKTVDVSFDDKGRVESVE